MTISKKSIRVCSVSGDIAIKSIVTASNLSQMGRHMSPIRILTPQT